MKKNQTKALFGFGKPSAKLRCAFCEKTRVKLAISPLNKEKTICEECLAACREAMK